MGERRKARRYEVYLPVQVCMSKHRPLEFHTGQLRDVSRTGIFFHSDVAIPSGTGLELTFSLPAERERGTSVLVRASARTLRSTQMPLLLRWLDAAALGRWPRAGASPGGAEMGVYDVNRDGLNDVVTSNGSARMGYRMV